MNPASRKPTSTSFHTISQSLRKLCATSDQALALVKRRRIDNRSPALWCWWPLSACWACSRACSSSRLETSRRKSTAMIAISTRPPTNSASVNCQPISTHITIPSSITRFVELNWNASADAAEAPF